MGFYLIDHFIFRSNGFQLAVRLDLLCSTSSNEIGLFFRLNSVDHPPFCFALATIELKLLQLLFKVDYHNTMNNHVSFECSLYLIRCFYVASRHQRGVVIIFFSLAHFFIAFFPFFNRRGGSLFV